MEIQAFFGDYFLSIMSSLASGLVSSANEVGNLFLLPLIFLLMLLSRFGLKLREFNLIFCAGFFLGFIVDRFFASFVPFLGQNSFLVLGAAIILLIMQLFFVLFISGVLRWPRLHTWLHSLIDQHQFIICFLITFVSSLLIFMQKRSFFEQFFVTNFLSFISLAGLCGGLVLFNIFYKYLIDYKKYDKWFYDLLVFFSWMSLYQSPVVIEALVGPWIHQAVVTLICAGIAFFYWMNVRMEIAHSYVQHYEIAAQESELDSKRNGVHFFNLRIFFKRAVAFIFIYSAIAFGINTYFLFKKVTFKQLLFKSLRSL